MAEFLQRSVSWKANLKNCRKSLAIYNNNYNNNYNNKNNNTKIKYNNKNFFNMTTLLFAIWSIVTLGHFVVIVNSAAIFSNVDIGKPAFEPLCHSQQEHFIESDGKDSSLILEFNSDVSKGKHKSCTRILSAPSNYGFIVRLILPKIHHQSIHHLSDGRIALRDEPDSDMPESAINDMTTLIEKLNVTAMKPMIRRTCPLNVFSSLDPHTPQWRVDPCQLEDQAPEMEDPVRLFQGRVRIVWEHRQNTLNSKLMVTALGKGEQCRSENKHPCLKIGEEPILCISKDLVCDGIRHCPNSNEYDTDEECWNKNKFEGNLPMNLQTGLFEHLALEVFKNLVAFDIQHNSAKGDSSNKNKNGQDPFDIQYLNVTTLRKVPKNEMRPSSNGTEAPTASGSTNETLPTGGHHRRNSTRNGIHSDLSKYGPWGYLMLGMLLCGGALLICGLWASASQQAANNERESAMANAANGNGVSREHSSVSAGPPNYEELDPPPAYSVLFPNQKNASNATLHTMSSANQNENATAPATPLSPSSRPACSGAANLTQSVANSQISTTPINNNTARQEVNNS